ncbi:hypothetical protein [Mediterraneibacter glycyrrhizinilyticus]|uniref:hypothetical protein n=1 Tax=Mediterraneibacter glycyrrhizinilyticus TaxID=342942 RepID=UPI0025A3EB0E|nr:hypothetical protein [Mediterraneibacter glycyrrhizinilyticus]MDM8126812.1 hypothetical protein [Mediterraneibacter glycyrrhizinilyticus]
MNWMRTILDGFAMAAYFNLFAAAVALYNPRLMFPSYPPAIIKNAPEPPSKAENRFYWLWVQSVDEKLRIAGASVAMAIDPVSPDGGGAGRDRSIVDEIINIEEIM